MKKRILGIALSMVLATSGFFSNVTLMSAEAATDVCITIDGDLTDWDHIEKMYTGEGKMVQMAAFQSDDSIYLMRELSDMETYSGEQIFFDADGDLSDGYMNAGIDWMLQGSYWYKYTGTNGDWGWQDLGNAKYSRSISDDKTVAEYKIPLSSFDDYKAGAISVNVCPYSVDAVGAWETFASYPASTTELAEIPAYADVYGGTAGTPITNITESVFSGQNGQWHKVEHDEANSASVLKTLKAVTDGTYLYAYVEAATLSDNAVFYIATSANDGMDISDTWEDAGSVKYKVGMDGALYEYAGTWNKIRTVDIYKTGVGAEIKVALSDIGNASGTIRVGVEEDGCYLPNPGRELFAVTTPILEEMPEITHDGKPSDWDGIEPLAPGTGTVGELYAVHDDNWLYVMTYLNNVTAADLAGTVALSTNLIINGDGDITTGFQHEAYPNGSGADFLIQDWNSVECDEANVEFFYTTQSNGGWDAQAGKTNYKKYSDQGNGVYCIEFAIPVSVMRETTNTVSDDMYVAVHRSQSVIELNTGTKEGGTDADAMVFVPKYNTSVPVSVGDKTFCDWNSVARNVANSTTDLTCNLLATKSGERLYTLVTNEIGGLNTLNTYFISTSDDTGYTYSGYKKVDYIVKDAKLFKVTANNTLSGALDDVWMSYYNDNIEMQLYLSQIGNPETIKIAYQGIGGELVIPGDGTMLNVTAEFEMERADGYYYPVEDFASFYNPYKGWVAWASSGMVDDYLSGRYRFDFDTLYLAVRWSELQPNSDKDWELDAILEKYGVNEWVKLGKRINLRFVMDNPEPLNGQKQRMDIPQWLYEELVAADIAAGGTGSGAGTFYHDKDGSTLGYDQAGFSPNYYSEKMIERHDEIIMKLAEYFDNNQITAFVQVGSLGHWGEMHTWPDGTGVWPDPATVGRYMESYTKYFKNVKVGTRKPFPYAAANNYGLFNDIFGVDEWGSSGTPDYYDYFMNGCWDMGGGATSADVAASKMPNFWKYNYSGGEFANGEPRNHITNETALDGTKGIMGSMDQARYTHVSWLGPCSPAGISIDDNAGIQYEANVMALMKLMGYNFALEKITRLTEITKGTDTAISMIWNNEGVAPFYYEWLIEFSLIDGSGKVVYSTEVDGDITNWLPGRSNVDVSINIPEKVPAGEYTLAVAIADKDTLEPGMYLAIDGGRDDKRYPLYTVSVVGEDIEGGDDSGNTGGGDDNGNTGDGDDSGNTGGVVSKYNVKFDGNGSTSGSMSDLKDLECGTDYKLSSVGFKRTGYTFKGWTLDKNGAGTLYKNGATVKGLTATDGQTITLYAQWTANKYTIKFNKNGKGVTGKMNNMTNREYGKSYKLTKNTFKRKGYVFKGWTLDSKGNGKIYKNQASVKNLVSKNNGSVTLYAKWKAKNYKITYKLNGGKNNSSNPKKYTVATKTVKLKAPTKKGYTFKGWYKDKKFRKPVKKITKGSTGNITLYAKWEEKE